MEKRENKTTNYSSTYLDAIANAYIFYKDWDIARDIVGIKNLSMESTIETKEISYD